MAAIKIGKVTAPSKKTYEVRWDAASKDVYIKYTGGIISPSGATTHVGKAASAQEAMTIADAAVYDK